MSLIEFLLLFEIIVKISAFTREFNIRKMCVYFIPFYGRRPFDNKRETIKKKTKGTRIFVRIRVYTRAIVIIMI